MRSEWDALRSVAKYLAVCAPDWEVRLDDDVATFPYMKVEPNTPATYSGSWHTTDVTMGVWVSAYAGEKPTVEAARETASKVQTGLQDAFRRGDMSGRGKSMRIPLYDFDGLTLDQVAPEDARDDWDYLRIIDFTAQQLPDPEDKSRIAVVANIRLSWRRVGAVPSGSQTLEAVHTQPGSLDSVNVHP